MIIFLFSETTNIGSMAKALNLINMVSLFYQGDFRLKEKKNRREGDKENTQKRESTPSAAMADRYETKVWKTVVVSENPQSL
jgi:hypothetical protein